MNHVPIPGCERMVFIRSGNYDYAEVDFRGSVHLVGRNNVGKTSIISAVQFLFVPDQSDMRFDGHTLEDTRRYYFKHPTSYILFECFSAETQSYVTVGMHGLGAIGSYKFERFAFPGRFERSMFVDENEIAREFDAVKADIMASRKHFRLLEPKDLRATLTGTWDDRLLNLGIIPLRDGTANERFVHLFRNLLKLNKMEQEAIKQTLVEVYRREFTKPTIDLQKEHESAFARVEREGRAIQQQELVETRIPALRKALDEQKRARLALKPMHRVLMAARQAEDLRLNEAKLATDDVLGGFESSQRKLNAKFQESTDKLVKIGIQIANLEADTTAFNALQDRFQGYVIELEETKLQNAIADLEALQAKYYGAGDSVEDIQRDITHMRAELAELVRLRDRHDKLFGSYIVGLVGENQVRDVFRVLNPKLLEREVDGEEGISVTDADALIDALNHVDRLIDSDEKRFDGHGVSFPMSVVGGPKGVLPDVAQLGRQIEEMEAKIETRMRNLDDALARAQVKAEIQERQRERDERKNNLEAFEAYRNLLAGRPAKLKEEAELQAKSETLIAEQTAISAERDRLSLQFAQAQTQHREIAERMAKLARDNFERPLDDWEDAGDDDQYLGIPYADMTARYVAACAAERSLTEKLASQIANIETAMQDGLAGSAPEQKAQSAIEMVESLPERRAAYDSMWDGLVVSIKASIRDLLDDVSRLKTKVVEFNRRLSGVQVSNLKSVSMEIVENVDRIRSYRSLFNTGGLFDREEDTKRAIEEVSKLIRGANAKVTLTELFGVEFKVEYQDGSSKTFPKLDAIESTGTTMMIKALVNMCLMRDMMKRDRRYSIPFYIDECNMVDETNLKGLAKTALKLGFIPVLASTMAVAVAETLYYVRWAKAGRAVIEPKNRIRRREAPDEFAAAA
ncbi:chromosome partitioning protein ParA [Cupriavidus sp. DF5525]|uniref:chromosome partitioning protein ParA n=1 Tax=Cupriavidus sp. DF5525 TaxID=3160989 RepID=UPI0032DF004B